jgi:hypothetical protein
LRSLIVCYGGAKLTDKHLACEAVVPLIGGLSGSAKIRSFCRKSHALTDCDRDAVTAFIRRLYLAGLKDPKRLTYKGLQAMARG